jgi:hypothetical protein
MSERRESSMSHAELVLARLCLMSSANTQLFRGLQRTRCVEQIFRWMIDGGTTANSSDVALHSPTQKTTVSIPSMVSDSMTFPN